MLAETDSTQTLDVLERLRRRWHGAHPEITFSAGFATNAGAVGVEELLRQADQALYAAKAAGRDCFRGVSARPSPDRPHTAQLRRSSRAFSNGGRSIGAVQRRFSR